ncbi:MAG: PepSY-associated TM helix domain-containing protein [Bacteroidales bacterium]|nr:PepSY-associated TM helix domain-containing protein [Bacteroidales bacterium]
MKWRKWNRIIHRDLGYIFFGMSIIYGLSGIALNHMDDWNPDFIIKTLSFDAGPTPNSSDQFESWIKNLVSEHSPGNTYKSHYLPREDLLKAFLKGGSIAIDLNTGQAVIEKIKRRPVFREVNFLHYNKPKKLWTWISDFFAGALILMAISGLFMIRGKKGITGRGAWLTSFGIIIPLIFLIRYLWS